MKAIKIFTLIILVGLISFLGFRIHQELIISPTNEPEPSPVEEPVSHWQDYNLVMHALGAIHGIVDSNTKEALLENYLRGGRVFEVDLFLTSDNRLVAVHQSRILTLMTEEDEITLDEIINHSFYRNRHLTPLTFVELANIMMEHPDIFIITDTKNMEKEVIQAQFRYIYKIASEKDIKILNRIIPQIYHPDMFQYIEEIFSFEEYIWTLYQIPEITNEEIFEFLEGHPRITALTLPHNSPRLTRNFISSIGEMNVLVYIHTLNNLATIIHQFERGVWGFYTAFVTEDYIYRNRLLRHQIRPLTDNFC